MPTNPPASKADKVLELSLELMEAEQDYKDTAKAHRENIKRVKAEIKELLEETEPLKV